MILLALEAGKHVISEKPVGPDEAVARKLVRDYQTIYQARGLIWSVAENYRYEPAFDNVLRPALAIAIEPPPPNRPLK